MIAEDGAGQVSGRRSTTGPRADRMTGRPATGAGAAQFVAANRWAGQSAAALRARWGCETVHLVESVTSTNDVARALAEAGAVAPKCGGAPDGTVVLAAEQTAGRGRGERTWSSPAGAGLYLSMVFRPLAAPSPLATLVAGVDVARELNRRFPGAGVAVKWPNDLIARDRKLGGILVEAIGATPADERRMAPAGGGVLIAGVGINVEAGRLPAEMDGAIALDECIGREHHRPAVLVEVASAVVAGLRRRLPSAPSGLDEAAMAEIDGLDWLRHRTVEHRLPGRKPVIGVAAGMAPDGALLLRPPRGELHRAMAGTVRVTSSAVSGPDRAAPTPGAPPPRIPPPSPRGPTALAPRFTAPTTGRATPSPRSPPPTRHGRLRS